MQKLLLILLLGAGAGSPLAASPTHPAVPVAEHEAVEHTIRRQLQLSADAPIGPAELARITELDLSVEPITDAAVAWLADPATGLTSLSTLYLGGDRVTDAGLAKLAGEDTGLKALTTVLVRGTRVTEVGAAAVRARWPGLEIRF